MLIVKNSPASAGDIRDIGSIPGSGRSPGGEHGIPLQYSCLENPMDRGAWQAIAHGVAKSQTWLKQLSLHTHEKYLAEYLYKDTKKKKEDNISKFKNRWIFQKKKMLKLSKWKVWTKILPWIKTKQANKDKIQWTNCFYDRRPQNKNAKLWGKMAKVQEEVKLCSKRKI